MFVKNKKTKKGLKPYCTSSTTAKSSLAPSQVSCSRMVLYELAASLAALLVIPSSRLPAKWTVVIIGLRTVGRLTMRWRCAINNMLGQKVPKFSIALKVNSIHIELGIVRKVIFSSSFLFLSSLSINIRGRRYNGMKLRESSFSERISSTIPLGDLSM